MQIRILKMKFLAVLILWTSICVVIVSSAPKKKPKTHKPGQSPESRKEKEPHSKFKIADCPSTDGHQSPIDLVHPWRVAPGGIAEDSALPGHYAFSKDGRDFKHTMLRGNTWVGRSRDRFYAYYKDEQITYEFLRNTNAPTSEMTIRGEDWDDEYVVAFGRVTWGLGNHRGSEHMIDGRRFPVELQFLHYRKSDGSMEAAWKNKGVLIVSLLLELSGMDNPHLEPLIMGATTPTNRRSLLRIDDRIHGPINLRKILTSDHVITMNYFEYEGSSTIPPCQGGVKWIVFDQPSTISDRQLGMLRRFVTDDTEKLVGDNFRPLQPVGTRTVKYYGSTLVIMEDEGPLNLGTLISYPNPGTFVLFISILVFGILYTF